MATIEEVRDRLRAFDARKAKFYEQHEAEISELTATCKKSQGEYISAFHGSGSWATTYSNEFIAASSRLYILFETLNSIDPLDELASLFQRNEIRSCRGSTMYPDKVEYLYITHLRGHIRNHR
jgi:hypothetical protein